MKETQVKRTKVAASVLNPRMALGLAVLAGAGLGAWWMFADHRLTAETGGFLRDGEAGFVVTQFEYALGPDGIGTGACPDGASKNVTEIFAETAEGRRRPGESDEAYGERLEAGGRSISSAADGRNFCAYPEIAPRDPHYRVLVDPAAVAEGIDLDGENTRSPGDFTDFAASDGTVGVDNQFRRAVGCNRSYQAGGMSRGFQEGIYVGEWGILITLGGVDDLENDSAVDVVIAASADPMMLSPSREALEFATYARDPDPQFRGRTRGRIVDGVLVTEPVDVQFHSVVNGMYLVRPLRSARIRATISADGVLAGYLSGYTPVEDMYDFQFGYRNGRDAEGNLSDERRRLQSANGAARVLGHTCQGVWQALHRLADGHPNDDGEFTSISTQYRFEARPAFVVENAEGDSEVRTDG